KFHPLAVHFPIAIILAAALAEMLNLRLKRPIFSLSARYLVILGALSALGTAGLGWAAGAYAHFPGELAATLVWHRWLGTAAAATAVLAGIFSGLRSRYQNSAAMCRLYLVSLFASAALVGLAGHLGAMLVYGWQHFTW
ncbi:MAG: hypothetical protein KJ052_12985, partial [Candidatus Hydrogenedentes bacterium]|nr:hypothetical protein [Candidatus Hydrogenedentota bacterium]